MAGIDIASDPMKGLHKDRESGNYRVESGYSYQALRYRIHETWLDEDDNLWIDEHAVERLHTDDPNANHNQPAA